jgi:hypothetical protein
MKTEEEEEMDDDDRQAWFWRHRPDGFAVNEKDHITYILEFKRLVLRNPPVFFLVSRDLPLFN